MENEYTTPTKQHVREYSSNPYEDDFQEVEIQFSRPTPVAGTPNSHQSQRTLPPAPASAYPSAPVEAEQYNDAYEYDYVPKRAETIEQAPTYQHSIDLIRRDFEIQITGPGRLCMYEHGKKLYTIVIDLKNFKLEVRDSTEKICAYVKAHLLPIRDTYKVQLPSGIEIGEFVKRIKLNLSGERKYHYTNKISDEKMKIVGNIKRGSFNIVRGDERLGTWNFSSDTGLYTAIMEKMAPDDNNHATLHVACLLFVSVLDHMATRKS